MNLSKRPPLHTAMLRLVPILLIAAVAVHYYWYMERFAVNMPFQDDVLDVLKFISGVIQSADWQTTLQHFHEQHTSHRTTASRLVFFCRVPGAGRS